MKGRISVICKTMLESEEFPKDFFDEHVHMMIGRSYELQSNRLLQKKYDRTELCSDETLKLISKSKMLLFYPSDKYLCNIGQHRQLKQAAMLFGTKSNDGHAFAVCSDCLFMLSLMLLKYCKYGEFYCYRKSSRPKLEKAPDTSSCYLCMEENSQFFSIALGKHNIILCKKCFDRFTELILTSPTVAALFPTLAEEYAKLKMRSK